jgi:hypothetical protein
VAYLCPFLAVLLGIFLVISAQARSSSRPEVGVLTQAYQAHVNEWPAFPGLALFEGQQLVTDEQGRIGVRIGHSFLTLGGGTEAVIFRTRDGIHVDLTHGAIFFRGAEGEIAEVQVGELLLRTAAIESARTEVSLRGSQALQVTAQKGGLYLNHRDEFRFLPQGHTYRISVDRNAMPQIETIRERAVLRDIGSEPSRISSDGGW